MKTFLVVIYLIIYGCVSYAQPPSTSYHTIADGAWTDNIWTNSGTCSVGNCSCNPGCPLTSNSNIFVCHIVTANCDIDIGSNSSLTVLSGGDLSVIGGGSITGTGDFAVESGASVTISGDLDISGNGDLLIDGDMTVTGNLDMSGSGSLCGTGNLTVGSMSGSAPCGSLNVGVLPVEMLSFSAENEGDINSVSWVTATEENNDYFVLLKSNDGFEFREVATLAGAGNSSSVTTYTYEDRADLGANYYKLVQVDYDGATEEFGPVVAYNLGSEGDITIFPNPTNEFVTISGLSADKEYNIKIVNSVGDEVALRTVNTSQSLELDVQTLHKGAYFVFIQTKNNSWSKKLIVN